MHASYPSFTRVVTRFITRFCLLIVLPALPATASPFADDFEAGAANWIAGGGWGLTTARYASPNHSAADSPGTFYTNNTDAALTLTAPVNLSGAVRPALSFQHQHALESGYDFAVVEISVDGGGSWISPALAVYTGSRSGMAREQLDLSPYSGAANVRVRFRLVTDSSVVMDGWYVDDVRIGEAPAPVTLQATQTNRNSVGLAWELSAAPDFAAYQIYRSTSPGVDWRTARVVAELNSATTTNTVDFTASPKTKYFYRVAVVNTNGMLTLGNEIAATTLPGMDYPFLDNGEGGPNTWVADAPWALSAEAAASPAQAWSDSPGTNYANGIGSQALTLAAPLFLAGHAVAPVLSFHHQYDFASGDSGNAEVSLNNGADWALLASFTGNFTNGWRRERLSLAAYTNATILIRFRLTTDPGNTADGWHLDDLSVAESPAVVPAPVLDQVTSHSIRVTWAANTNAFFARYAIFRSIAPGVGINSTLVATVAEQSTTSFTDTDLALDTVYYYRVYAVSGFGTYSPDSPQESSTRTLNNPPPFVDDLESDRHNWNYTGSWGLTTNEAHSGTTSLTDSPQGVYANGADSHAWTAVNLVGTTWPVLKFWERYRFVDGDWGRVEVSTDGANWQILYGVMGVVTNWLEQVIDLSQWKNQSNLRIRFRVGTDGATTEDGWYLDDVSVVEHAPITVPFPLFEGFESGLNNWLASGWAASTNQPYVGNNSARDGVTPRLAPDSIRVLELAGPLVLSNAVNPQLTFWVRGQINPYAWLRLNVSTDGGLNWAELSSANVDYPFNADWTRRQVSLQAYTNRTIRLKFFVTCDWRAPDEDLFLDKLVIAEMPAPVVLNPPIPHLRSVDLDWTESTLGGAFKRYEVYRATHPAVTLSDTQVAAFTAATNTVFTDTGLSIGVTYYYQVFTVDTNDVYSPSNERSVTTVPVSLPMTDALETMDQWVATGSWGVTAGGRSGSCLNDSPTGDYANSTDTYVFTAVNLNGSTWPVLRFWDRHRIGNGDWGRVEISTDGANWQILYGVTSVRTNWAEQVIDLSQWKNQSNLRLRFRLGTDGAATDDGWFIDDVAVTENTAVPLAFPFYEGFENGMSNWLASGWTLASNQPLVGSWSAHDTAVSRLGPDTTIALNLAGPLVLSNAVNPQLTFWVRGQINPYAWLRLNVSTDGGLNWAELSSANVDYPFNADWTRRQVSLQAYTNRTIRLKFFVTCDWRAPDEDLFLDKLSIEEAPTAVVLNPITEATVSTLRLAWTAAAILNFKEYRVYRSETPTVTEASTLVTTITNPSVTNFTDAGLMSRKTYYYKVYLYNTNDTGNESNQASAMTLGVPPGWTEDFETNQPAWTFTGLWSRMNGVGRNGGTALVDSPADYGNSTDTAAQFAVNLIGTSWPVLRFWDRYTMANGDFGRLEVSINAGASWQLVYGVAATRADWVEQSVDLSRWKNYSQVWIRFRVFTDGSVPADGWYLDDVSLVENTTPAVGQPFFDSFENGLALWQHAGWTLSTNQPYAGGFTVQDTPEGRMPTETELALNLASSIVLTNAVNPQLTFWVRGVINPYAWLRAQVSADGGINWTDLSAGNVDYPFNATWTRKQISLAAYTNQTIRLRFYTACDWRAPEEDLFLDNIGVGEPAPGAPSLVSPVPLSSVTVVRPLLVVSNAIDYQSDPLSYRFEVYADVGLSNLVAQVPLVASGSDTTAWQVDTDLPNNQQYWWRCRATDSSNAGPWMATATFFVNETNHPPTTPLIAGPPNGTLVTNLNELLSWFPVIDPDEGDDVAGYQLQVAAEPAFLAPLINATNLPAVTGPAGTNWTIAVALGDLPGAGNLTPGTVCYWRVGAFDLRGLSSDWSPGLHAFQFGIAPPQAGTITALHRQDNGQLTMEWTGAAGLIFVEFSHTLNPPLWFTVAGPLPGTNWTFAPVPGTPSGFYRLRSE